MNLRCGKLDTTMLKIVGYARVVCPAKVQYRMQFFNTLVSDRGSHSVVLIQ